MMSKKQWLVLLCMYIVYLLLGACIFFEVEREEELRKQAEELREREHIEELLITHYQPTKHHSQSDIFRKLSRYCGKSLNHNMTQEQLPQRWDYYHSLFFVVTVVSTIGYGNLAPTTTLTRVFMIFYALIGIPINGIVMVTMGDFFGRSFTKLYDRWKTQRVQHALATLGLIGQIILYLVPGFTFLIVLPSIIIMVYERWPYDVAVYYAFVTLTTIGFGDYVAGVQENGYNKFTFLCYKFFLLIWIIVGLGYVVMVLGFISRGMQSKKMLAFEHKIAYNIKKTNNKIREEFRSVLNEFLLMKVKRVYRERFVYVPTKCVRSQSCPDLSIYRDGEFLTLERKRAFSTVANIYEGELQRIQSDTDLERIDKELTFNPANAVVEPSQLLMRVVNALGKLESSESEEEEEGFHGFSDEEILASEQKSDDWGSQIIPRPRAASDCVIPQKQSINNSDLTWYGPAATKRLQELRNKTQNGMWRRKTLPVQPVQPVPLIPNPQGLLSKLKQTLKPTQEEDNLKTFDVEKQDFTEEQNRYVRQTRSGRTSTFSVHRPQVLEETSLADFIRALTAISVPEVTNMKRKMGTAGLNQPIVQSPPRTRRAAIRPAQSRRTSLIPSSPSRKERRFSLRPADNEDGLKRSSQTGPPPPYSRLVEHPVNLPQRIISRQRKFSLRPVPSVGNSPVQRQANKLKDSKSDSENRDNREGDPTSRS